MPSSLYPISTPDLLTPVDELLLLIYCFFRHGVEAGWANGSRRVYLKPWVMNSEAVSRTIINPDLVLGFTLF
uniref:Uncharacterized protein n=1 Tax=Pristionchus pacificus TaxID=54126 RepID=A0A2A6CIE3_PRIPA|eukprot:PDM77909.1 hypothetical protein PRIPAC_34776 [Pristionchus pacificus]